MTVPVKVPPLPPLGGDVVGFTTLTPGGPVDTLGEQTLTPNTVTVSGCRHRPLSATETPVGLTDIGTQVYQTHLPPDTAVLAANMAQSLTGQLVCNGIVYQILGGLQVFTRDDGAPYFIKVLSKLEKG